MSFTEELNLHGPAGTAAMPFSDIVLWCWVSLCGSSLLCALLAVCAVAGRSNGACGCRCVRRFHCCKAYEEAEEMYTAKVASTRAKILRNSKVMRFVDMPTVSNCKVRAGRPPVTLCVALPLWLCFGMGLVIEYFHWAQRVADTIEFQAVNTYISTNNVSILAWINLGGLGLWALCTGLEILLVMGAMVGHCRTMRAYKGYVSNPDEEHAKRVMQTGNARSPAVWVTWLWLFRGVGIAVAYFCAAMYVSVSSTDKWLIWAIMVGVWISMLLQVAIGAAVWIQSRRIQDVARALTVASLPPVDDKAREDKDYVPKVQHGAIDANDIALTIDGGGEEAKERPDSGNQVANPLQGKINIQGQDSVTPTAIPPSLQSTIPSNIVPRSQSPAAIAKPLTTPSPAPRPPTRSPAARSQQGGGQVFFPQNMPTPQNASGYGAMYGRPAMPYGQWAPGMPYAGYGYMAPTGEYMPPGFGPQPVLGRPGAAGVSPAAAKPPSVPPSTRARHTGGPPSHHRKQSGFANSPDGKSAVHAAPQSSPSGMSGDSEPRSALLTEPHSMGKPADEMAVGLHEDPGPASNTVVGADAAKQEAVPLSSMLPAAMAPSTVEQQADSARRDHTQQRMLAAARAVMFANALARSASNARPRRGSEPSGIMVPGPSAGRSQSVLARAPRRGSLDSQVPPLQRHRDDQGEKLQIGKIAHPGFAAASLDLKPRLEAYFRQVDPGSAAAVSSLLAACGNGQDVEATVRMMASLEEQYGERVPAFAYVMKEPAVLEHTESLSVSPMEPPPASNALSSPDQVSDMFMSANNSVSPPPGQPSKQPVLAATGSFEESVKLPHLRCSSVNTNSALEYPEIRPVILSPVESTSSAIAPWAKVPGMVSIMSEPDSFCVERSGAAARPTEPALLNAAVKEPSTTIVTSGAEANLVATSLNAASKVQGSAVNSQSPDVIATLFSSEPPRPHGATKAGSEEYLGDTCGGEQSDSRTDQALAFPETSTVLTNISSVADFPAEHPRGMQETYVSTGSTCDESAHSNDFTSQTPAYQNQESRSHCATVPVAGTDTNQEFAPHADDGSTESAKSESDVNATRDPAAELQSIQGDAHTSTSVQQAVAHPTDVALAPMVLPDSVADGTANMDRSREDTSVQGTITVNAVDKPSFNDCEVLAAPADVCTTEVASAICVEGSCSSVLGAYPLEQLARLDDVGTGCSPSLEAQDADRRSDGRAGADFAGPDFVRVSNCVAQAGEIGAGLESETIKVAIGAGGEVAQAEELVSHYQEGQAPEMDFLEAKRNVSSTFENEIGTSTNQSTTSDIAACANSGTVLAAAAEFATPVYVDNEHNCMGVSMEEDVPLAAADELDNVGRAHELAVDTPSSTSAGLLTNGAASPNQANTENLTEAGDVSPKPRIASNLASDGTADVPQQEGEIELRASIASAPHVECNSPAVISEVNASKSPILTHFDNEVNVDVHGVSAGGESEESEGLASNHTPLLLSSGAMSRIQPITPVDSPHSGGSCNAQPGPYQEVTQVTDPVDNVPEMPVAVTSSPGNDIEVEGGSGIPIVDACTMTHVGATEAGTDTPDATILPIGDAVHGCSQGKLSVTAYANSIDAPDKGIECRPEPGGVTSPAVECKSLAQSEAPLDELSDSASLVPTSNARIQLASEARVEGDHDVVAPTLQTSQDPDVPHSEAACNVSQALNENQVSNAPQTEETVAPALEDVPALNADDNLPRKLASEFPTLLEDGLGRGVAASPVQEPRNVVEPALDSHSDSDWAISQGCSAPATQAESGIDASVPDNLGFDVKVEDVEDV